MPMRIPQPIQIWFNSLHYYRKKIQSHHNDSTLLIDKSDEKFIDYNPLLIGGIENLLLEMIPKNSKSIIKDGANEVAQWICQNLILLYDININDDYNKLDITNSSNVYRNNLLNDIQLITIELLPTIIYVYFCLFIFFESTKSYQTKSPISNKSDIKLNKLFNFDKFHSLLKQNEDITQMLNYQSNNLLNINKQLSITKSQIINQSINELSPSSSSFKLENNKKYSTNIHKLIKQQTKLNNEQQQKNKKKQINELLINEQINLINIFEVFLFTIYQIYQRKNLLKLSLNEENIEIHFEPISLCKPSIYCDELFNKNEINKMDYLTKLYDQLVVLKQSDKLNNEQDSNRKLNEYTFNSRNRMHILTALMKEYSAYSPSCVSKQSRISLCKLACLFNPFSNQYSENMPLQFEESDLVDNDGHTCDTNSMKLENISGNEKEDNSVHEGATSQPTSPKSLGKMEEHTSKGMQNSYTNLETNRQLKFSRVTGLSSNFVIEILFSLYPVLFTEHSDLACEGVKSLKARATYEIWSNVLLLINSIEKDYTRSKSPDLKLLKFDNRVISQEVLNNSNFNECSVEEHKLDSEQLSLASAYCGLWSGLLGKRSDIQQNEVLPELCDIQDLSGKRLHYVRLAQAKFKRPVVTNSDFKTVKLPDDITPLSPIDKTTSKQNENKNYLSTHDNVYLKNNWKSSLDDLSRIEEPIAASNSFTREWFKKTLWKDRQSEKF
ncbi:unnamed protein product [Schistosoma rodhaini]|nr:unnamed protein product [Schistosoma rodhaini]